MTDSQKFEPRPPTVPKPSQNSTSQLYVDLCAKLGVTPNSVLKQYFSTIASLDSVESLDLHSNYLGDRGVLPVIDMLDQMKSLKSVVLRENGLRNNGCIALCAALKTHPSVESVDIAGNQISLGGGKAILELLASNPRIKEVDFSRTRIEADLRLKLKSALEKRLSTSTSP